MKFGLVHVVFFVLFCYNAQSYVAQSLVINEVMFANRSSLTDADGHTPDWIELYNADTVPLQLNKFGLTDKAELDDVWQIPTYALNPGEFIVIFASGKNRSMDNEFHTNFKLGLMEEQLFLVYDDSRVIDYTTVQCVPPNHSLICMPDGDTSLRKVAQPTPGWSNNQAQIVEVNYIADSLWFNVQGGFYTNNVELEMFNKHEQNSIRCTLDADDPNERDFEFQGVMSLHDLTNEKNRFADKIDNGFKLGDAIAKAPVVRAQVFSNGCPASQVVSQVYFIGSHFHNRYHVPMVSIVTDKDNLFDEDEGIYVQGNHHNYYQQGKAWERMAHVTMYDENGEKIIEQNAGLRIHGAGSRLRPQKSLRLYARDKYGDSIFEYPFFNQKPHLQTFKRLLLRSVKDWGETLLKDDLAQQLVSDMNIDYTASQPSVVFINGEYWGIYSLRERQDEYYVAANYNVDKPDLNVVAYTRGGLQADEGELTNYNNLLEWLQAANPESFDFYESANTLVNLDAMIDYYVAQLYFANTDWPENNFRLWRMENDTSRWRYYFYDCDACMMQFDYNILTDYTHDNSDLHKYKNHATYVFRRMMQNRTFSDRFRSQLAFHMTQTFGTQRVVSEIERLKAVYAPLVSEHAYRWNTPTDLVMWINNVERLESFAVQRPMEMRNQLVNQLGQPLVVYPNPSYGEIYFKALWGNGQAQISIVDLSGKVMYQTHVVLDEQNAFSPTVKLPPGAYIVNVMSDGMRFQQKLVVID